MERWLKNFRTHKESLKEPGGQFSYDRFVFGEGGELFGAGDRTTIARRVNKGFEVTYTSEEVLNRIFNVGRGSVHFREIPNSEGVGVLVARVNNDSEAEYLFTWQPHHCKPSDRMDTIEVALNNQLVFERPVGSNGDIVLRCDLGSNTIQIISPQEQITIRYL